MSRPYLRPVSNQILPQTEQTNIKSNRMIRVVVKDFAAVTAAAAVRRVLSLKLGVKEMPTVNKVVLCL